MGKEVADEETSRKKPKSQYSIYRINLTDKQKAQIQVIDGKRCSIRCLLLLSHIILAHLVIYTTVMTYAHQLIRLSFFLQFGFYGYNTALFVCFFGNGYALQGVTYAWSPKKFILGFATVLFGIGFSCVCYFVANTTNGDYKGGLLISSIEYCDPSRADHTQMERHETNKRHNIDEDTDVCVVEHYISLSLLFIPMSLPPCALILGVLAAISAFRAVYIIPKKLPDEKIDAVWLEPYEVYDFYLGRPIPKIPGQEDEDIDIDSTHHSLASPSHRSNSNSTLSTRKSH